MSEPTTTPTPTTPAWLSIVSTLLPFAIQILNEIFQQQQAKTMLAKHDVSQKLPLTVAYKKLALDPDGNLTVA